MRADGSAREAYLAAIRHGGDRPHALAAECYREPAFFDVEVEHVLRPGWHAMARWDDLTEPGDYAAVDLAGEPLLLVRDGAETLRVFSRVCRHRAHTVVEGTGNTKQFACPYHRWSYGLDGALRNAPLTDDTPGFDREKCGLPELRTETWLGFTLVSLDPEAEPLSTRLEQLDARLRPLGLAEMETIGVLDFDSPWNWKVMVDNFMESYHHLGPHTDSLQKTNQARETYSVGGLDGPFSILENPGKGDASSFTVAQVFPTLLLAVFEGDPVGSWYEMQIDRHDHFHLRIHMLAAPELAASAETKEAIMEAATGVHLEDIPVCEGVQRGIASRLWSPGPLLSPLEGCLTRFHEHLAERLAG